jgi:branched-chain amino acid transport system ATP-binding protein
MALLELEGVDAFYARIQALHGIGLTLDKGEIVALIGSNGAGKTTTLRTISGLMHPAAGTIMFDGRDISRLPPHEIVGLGICQAPEGRRLFQRLTVQENLEMGAYSRRDRAGVRQSLERVFTLFPRVKERRNQLAGTLSGGEQQMVAISRALMANPRVMMLDEPSLGLAPLIVDTIFEIINEINSSGVPILLVEQNAVKALNVAHRAYVLETGTIVKTGPGKELAQSEDIQKAYLGV